jgi:CHAT domain-containing protein/Tfp pilus assembly protein PilF
MLNQRHIAAAAIAMALSCTVTAEPQQAAIDRLELQVRLARSLEGSAADRMIVALEARQFFRIEVMQAGTDVGLTLRDPESRVVGESDLPNGRYGPETVAAIAERSGDYLLEVRLSDQAEKGAYEVTLAEVRDPAPSDQQLIAAHRWMREAQQLIRKQTTDSRRAALDLLGQARDAFAKLGNLYYHAFSVYLLGSVLASSGEFRKALDLGSEAVDLSQVARDRHLEATARNNIGGILDTLGQPQEALDSYRQALALHRAIGDLSNQAIVLSNMGKIQSDFGDWQKALDAYKEALPLAREAGDTRRQALLLHNIGTAYLGLRDLDQAASQFQQALAIRHTLQDKRGEADTLRNIASVHLRQKQPLPALEYSQQALALYLQLGDRRGEAETRLVIGRVFGEAGKLPEAEESVRQALALERTLQRRRNAATAQLELGRVLELAGRPEDALQQAEQALTEFRAIGDKDSESISLEWMGRAESDRGNLDAARKHIEEALRLIEDTRKGADSDQLRASFFATRQDSFGFYIDLLMRLGDASAAMEASERARARSLLDMLSESGAEIREDIDPKLLSRERELSGLLNAKGARLLPLMGRDTPQAAALKQEIRVLETDYQETQAAIRKSNPRYAALMQPNPLTVKQIQEQVLDAGSVLLEYSLGEKRSYLWAVSHEGFSAWELPARDRIEGQVAEVYGLLTARSAVRRMETAAQRQRRVEQADASLPDAARRLSEMVIVPAASAIAGKRLVIVPEGALQRLPFAMLPIPGSAEPLVTAHEVVMLPSASALAVQRSELAGRKPAPKTLAVFADPVFDAADPRVGRGGTTADVVASPEGSRILEHLSEPGDAAAASLKIPRLPYTEQEADQILRVARDSSNWKASGFEASRASATSGQLSQYRYVHFATHGYLDLERPSLSGLVLSQLDEKRRPQDGFLRVNDIYNTRLSADLVVLSACQTGLGKEVRGEGLMGLTRAFLYAGAPRVVVSLWNVNDRATAELMAGLYRRMLREGKRPAPALREAQLELRKQKRWESPYYWAAFVQHGEWK